MAQFQEAPKDLPVESSERENICWTQWERAKARCYYGACVGFPKKALQGGRKQAFVGSLFYDLLVHVCLFHVLYCEERAG